MPPVKIPNLIWCKNSLSQCFPIIFLPVPFIQLAPLFRKCELNDSVVEIRRTVTVFRPVATHPARSWFHLGLCPLPHKAKARHQFCLRVFSFFVMICCLCCFVVLNLFFSFLNVAEGHSRWFSRHSIQKKQIDLFCKVVCTYTLL